MIFGTHIALDNSDHVLDGGPNPPHWGGFLQNVPRHNGGFTKRTTSRSGRPSSAVAELLFQVIKHNFERPLTQNLQTTSAFGC